MEPFHFKQFSLYHHRSTMKVGTDSVLLGSWCNVGNPNKVLDIGTGSGVLAILLASRCDAIVDAIELDPSSAEEAKENFYNSSFSNRLKIIQDDFRIFSSTTKSKYDLIISNPPFFTNGIVSEKPSRKEARHTLNLDHNSLLIGIAKILNPDGKLCVVLPYDISNEFIVNAAKYNLHLHRKLIIRPKKELKPNRINIEFRHSKPKEISSEEIIIRNDENDYTDQYKEIVKAYLLKT